MRKGNILRWLVCSSILAAVVSVAAQESPVGHAKAAKGALTVRGVHVPLVIGSKANPQTQPAGRPLGMTAEGRAAKERAVHGVGTPNPPPEGNIISSDAISGPAGSSSSIFNFLGIYDDGYAPPDVSIAAGPYQIVATSNLVVHVFDKTGVLLSSTSLSSLFSGTGIYAQDSITDPNVVYDPYVQRFWLVTTSYNDTAQRSTLLIAVSNSNDMLGGWTVFSSPATQNGSTPTPYWCDYPKVGIDAQAVYVTCNMFSFPTSNAFFQYAKIRVFSKAEFINGPCCGWTDFYQLTAGADTSFTVQPAIMHGAAASDGEYLINAAAGGGTQNWVAVWHIINAQNCCNGGSPAPTLTGYSYILGYTFSPAPPAVQPLVTTGLDTGDTRLLYATWLGGHLLTGQNANCNGAACAVFLELNISGFPTISTVSSFAYPSTAADYFYPALDIRPDGYKAAVMGTSNSSTYAGTVFITIPPSTTCTNCGSLAASMQPGLATYVVVFGGKNRWGDYFGAAADPDGFGIWISGEFAVGTNTWATQVGVTMFGYGPAANVNPASVSFGNVTVGNTVTSPFITVTNTGNSTLRISQIATSSDAYKEFDNCAIYYSIQQSQSCSIFVQFTPETLGSIPATLYIFDNASSSPQTVSLTGSGVGPWPSLSTSSISFLPQIVGTTSSAKTLTLSNTGTSALTISSIHGSGNFPASSTCPISPSTLAPGAHCSITVSFHPTVPGNINGEITIADNFGYSPELVDLSGMGLTPVTFSPSSLSFGTVNVGTRTGAKTVTVTNNLSTAVTLAFAASGDYRAVAGSTAGCSSTLAAKTNCQIAVTFAPTMNGSIKGSVALSYNSTFSPLDVPLSGSGSGGPASALSFSPTTLTFNHVLVGTNSGTRIVTVSNISASPVSISSLSASGNYQVVGTGTTPCPGVTLAHAATCTFSVTFHPTINGVIVGSIKIVNNSASNPQIYNLSGGAVLPIRFSPSSLSFPAQPVGTFSSQQVVTVYNDTNSTLSLGTIRASGMFSVVAPPVTGCSTSIAPYGSCFLEVSFGPEMTGTIHGVIAVNYIGSFSPIELNVTGVGQ